ncbi:putative glycoside hydrolase [Fimbriimonas ginsengisoli]|uniref:DUF4015 domain-containing protein n=1 Tax=Fimbriimonas ginsengisoli Gsoil 348 TaxID=661478 RepID=A0A068NTN6_FIMGI|nr:putative glycoside hydrolase [Fimbriimonas ginsengisoli]AIE86100.1 hypothetical protein OP10G_2732 [Fimbriimonas ginsengisoli Gsoil 348]
MKHWAWLSIDAKATTEDLRSKYRRLKEGGLHGVFLEGGIDAREFEIVREAGLELHSWMWTTNRREPWIRENHPEWFMVSRSGKSCFDQPPYVEYYRWISPFQPAVHDYLRDRAAELAAHPLVAGVHLDYVRFPDVILPRALWETYGLDQTEELADFDFDYSDAARAAFRNATGRDPLEIADPATDQEWLHFRYEAITQLVEGLAETVHAHGKEITAAVFPTPSMARKICRQSWDKWPLDAVCPMVYHSFYNLPTEWIGDAVRENIQAVRFPVYAGLYMPAFTSADDFEAGVRHALHRGAAGVSLFAANSILPEHFEALRRIADST